MSVEVRRSRRGPPFRASLWRTLDRAQFLCGGCVLDGCDCGSSHTLVIASPRRVPSPAPLCRRRRSSVLWLRPPSSAARHPRTQRREQRGRREERAGRGARCGVMRSTVCDATQREEAWQRGPSQRRLPNSRRLSSARTALPRRTAARTHSCHPLAHPPPHHRRRPPSPLPAMRRVALSHPHRTAHPAAAAAVSAAAAAPGVMLGCTAMAAASSSLRRLPLASLPARRFLSAVSGVRLSGFAHRRPASAAYPPTYAVNTAAASAAAMAAVAAAQSVAFAASFADALAPQLATLDRNAEETTSRAAHIRDTQRAALQEAKDQGMDPVAIQAAEDMMREEATTADTTAPLALAPSPLLLNLQRDLTSLLDSYAQISAGYSNLLKVACSSNSTPADVLKILGSWLAAPLPPQVFSAQQRVAAVTEVVQTYFIKHGRRLESRVGEVHEDPRQAQFAASVSASNAAQAVLSTTVPLAGSKLMAPAHQQTFEALLAPKPEIAPKDLFRDIILQHALPLDLACVKALLTHASMLRENEQTVATLHFLKHYQRQMTATRTKAMLLAVAEAEASAQGPIASLSATLHVDIAGFNSLLEVFSRNGDDSGATLLFTELAPASGSAAGHLFGTLNPNLATYTALLVSFCKNDRVANALALLEHVKTQHAKSVAAAASSEASSPTAPTYTPPAPALDMGIMEVMLRTLVESGHMQSAILALQRLQVSPQPAATDSTDVATLPLNSFGLPAPSMQCFLPLLLEIPRWKPKPAAPRSVAARGAAPSAFDSLAADEQLMLLAELYGSFRSLGHELPEDAWLLFLERTALMHSGMEIVTVGGTNNRSMELISHLNPPRGPTPAAGVSPFSNPQAPLDFALSVLNERLAPLLSEDPAVFAAATASGRVLSIDSFNSLLHLFGVVLGKSDFLSHFVSLMQRVGVAPNAQTINMLMESYGRSGLLDNVRYMFAQIQAAASFPVGAPGSMRPNTSSFNTMLLYTPLQLSPQQLAEKPQFASLAASPYTALRIVLADMAAARVAPNEATWLILLRRLLQASGNMDEAIKAKAMPPLPAAHSTFGGLAPAPSSDMLGPVSPFALPVREPGVVFELMQMMVECQQAADTAPKSPSALGAPGLYGGLQGSALLADLPTQLVAGVALPPSSPSLTKHTAGLYLSIAGRLSDSRTVLLLLESMKLSASNALLAASTTAPALAAVASALPLEFCREYFANWAQFKEQLSFRLAQLDWTQSVSLLRIWHTMSSASHAGSLVGGASTRLAEGEDGFSSLFRRIPDEATLQLIAKECFDQLVWGVDANTCKRTDAPLPTSVLSVSVRQDAVTTVAQALMHHGRFDALVSFLDLVADLSTPARAGASAALPLPFPAGLLPRMFDKLSSHSVVHVPRGRAERERERERASASESSSPFGPVWKLSVLARASAGGRWAQALALPESRNDVFNLYASVFSESVESSSASPESLWSIMQGALSVCEDASDNWQAQESGAHFLATTPARIGPSGAHVRHPQLIAMAELFLNYLAPSSALSSQSPMSNKFSQSAEIELRAQQVRRTSEERLPFVHLLLDNILASSASWSAKHNAGIPATVDPLLSPAVISQVLFNAMHVGDTKTVYAMWRYSQGMANPRLQYYDSRDALLPVPVPTDATLAASKAGVQPRPCRPVQLPESTWEHLMAFCVGSTVSPVATPVFSAVAAEPSSSSSSASSSDPSYPSMPPNPEFGFELYLAVMKENITSRRTAPPSVKLFRSAILLQGTYKPMQNSEATLDESSAVVAPIPFFGRGKLAALWTTITSRLLWFESLALLPYLASTLMNYTVLPQLSEDYKVKTALVAQLAAWAAAQSTVKLPQIARVPLAGSSNVSSVASSTADAAAAAAANRRGAPQSKSTPRDLTPAQKVQQREEKKLLQVRELVDLTFKRCQGMLGDLKMKLAVDEKAQRDKLQAQAAGEVVVNARQAEAVAALSARIKRAPGAAAVPAAPGDPLSEWLSNPVTIKSKAAYTALWARLQHPASWGGDPALVARVAEVLKNPRDFVDLTAHFLRTGWFEDTQRPGVRGSQGVEVAGSKQRASSLVFFDFMHSLLLFLAERGQQANFGRFMTAIQAHPQGLRIVLTPAKYAATANSADMPVVQPQEDVTVAFLQSIVHRRVQVGGSGKRGWEPVVGLGDKAPMCVNWKSPSSTVQGAHAIDLAYAGHEAWWATQSLYWHFRLMGLDVQAFDFELLHTITAATAPSLGGPVVAYGSADAVKAGIKPHARTVNPFVITPRVVYGWLTRPDITPRQVLYEAYTACFQFLVYQVKFEQSKRKASLSSVLSPASSPLPSASFVVSFSSNTGLPHASPQAGMLHHYTFQLFRACYRIFTDSGLALGHTARPKRDLRDLEAIVDKAQTARSLDTAAALDAIRGREAFDALVLRAQSDPASSNALSSSVGVDGRSLLYDLFYALSRSTDHPWALSENVLNMVLCSLVYFRHSGLSPATIKKIGAMIEFARAGRYQMQPASVGYMVEACIEQAAVELARQTTDTAGTAANDAWSAAEPFLQLASALLTEHKRAVARSSSGGLAPLAFDFGSESEDMLEPTSKVVLPPPAL